MTTSLLEAISTKQLDPVETAKKVLRTYSQGGPVSPEAIAAAAGVRVLGLPLLNGASGSYEATEAGPVIKVNRSEADVRQRFTVAHELGHHFLRHGKAFRDDSSNFSTLVRDWKEVQANRFAAELLMPEGAIRAAVKRESDISRLARMFDVSTAAIGFRLKNLGLVR